MKLRLIAPADVDGLWPLLAAGFQKACQRSGADDLNAGILWQMARSGDGFLIIALDQDEILQASIWRFDTPFDGFSLRCMMLYGHKMRAWYAPMWALITKIARQNGARRLVTKGRTGWLRQCQGARRVASLDYDNQTYDDYEVDLINGRF